MNNTYKSSLLFHTDAWLLDVILFILMLVCIAVLYYEFWWNLDLPRVQNSRLYLYGIFNSIHIWTLILSILGFAKRHLNFSNNFLRYTNKAVYPFYILHQTVIVVFGYYVVQWPIPIFIKLILLLIICFLTIGVLYNWIIKPFVITRILYGLKPKEKEAASNEPSVSHNTYSIKKLQES